MLCLVLPTITMENVIHKPQIDQFIFRTPPIQLPESVWNIKKDHLPWTLKLQDFAIFTTTSTVSITTKDVGCGKKFMLEPVNTSCTLGLSSRHHSNVSGEAVCPTLGICLHADTTALKSTINDAQLCLIIHFLEKLLSYLADLKPNWLLATSYPANHNMEDHTNWETMNKDYQCKIMTSSSVGLRETSPKGSEKLGDSISEQTRSAPQQQISQQGDSASMGKQKAEDSSANGATNALSLWLQWTIPQIKVSAISEAVGPRHQMGNVVKLELDMEDHLSSFDWTPVYFQMKMRIMNANVHHFVKPSSRPGYLGLKNYSGLLAGVCSSLGQW